MRNELDAFFYTHAALELGIAPPEREVVGFGGRYEVLEVSAALEGLPPEIQRKMKRRARKLVRQALKAEHGCKWKKYWNIYLKNPGVFRKGLSTIVAKYATNLKEDLLYGKKTK
jgi:hypothetical protein